MNQTNIDYLFQLTAPGTARPGENARQSGRLPAFDDLFSLASSANCDQPTSPPAGQERYGRDHVYPSNATQTPDSPSSLIPSRSSASSETPVPSDERRAAANIASNSSNESPSQRSDVSATEQDADDGEQVTDQQEPDEHSNAAEPAVAIAVSATTLEAKVDSLASAANSNEAEPAAEAATDENPADQQAGSKATRVDEQAARQAAAELTAPVSTEPTTDADGQSTSATKTKTVTAQEHGDPTRTHSAIDKGAFNSAADDQKAHAQSEAADANTLSFDVPADASIDAGDLSSEEPPTNDRPADTNRRADDSPSRTSEPAAARTSLRVEAAVPVAHDAPRAREATPATADEAPARAAGSTAAKSDALSNVSGRQQPGGAAAHRTQRGSGGDETPRVDPARFISRVAKAFQTASERGGTLHLRLNPPELGAMRLELTVKEGVMTATLETETAAARRVLLDHLPALRDRLAEQNIRVERFDVDVRRDGGGSHADGRAAHQGQQQQHQPEQPSQRRESTAPQHATETSTRDPAVTHNPINDKRINLVA